MKKHQKINAVEAYGNLQKNLVSLKGLGFDSPTSRVEVFTMARKLNEKQRQDLTDIERKFLFHVHMYLLDISSSPT